MANRTEVQIDRQALLRALRVLELVPGMKGKHPAEVPQAVVSIEVERLQIRCGNELASVLGTGTGRASARIDGRSLKLLVMDAKTAKADTLSAVLVGDRFYLGSNSVTCWPCEEAQAPSASGELTFGSTLECLVSREAFGDERVKQAIAKAVVDAAVSRREMLISEAVDSLQSLGVTRTDVEQLVARRVSELASGVRQRHSQANPDTATTPM